MSRLFIYQLIILFDITELAFHLVVTGILPTTTAAGLPANPTTLPNSVSVVSGGPTNVFDEILKATPAALIAFLANLPAVDGNLFYVLY